MLTTLDGIRDIRLYQPKSGYRFSVDSLLLFDFVSLKRVRTICDLGAGSGVVGLLLAKKYPSAKVTMVELQDSLYGMAKRNIELNGLEGRVQALRADIRELKDSGGFDLAVSNPPFRREASGRLSVESQRAIARHEVMLKLPELIKAAVRIRARRLCLVYLPERTAELTSGLKASGFEPKRMRFVHSSVHSSAKMVLVEAARGARPGLEVEPPVFVYDESGRYTKYMRVLFCG